MPFLKKDLEKYYPGFREIVDNEVCFNAVTRNVFSLDFLYGLDLVSLQVIIQPDIVSEIEKGLITIQDVTSLPSENLSNFLSPMLLGAMTKGILSFRDVAELDIQAQNALRCHPRLLQLIHVRLFPYAELKKFAPVEWQVFNNEHVVKAIRDGLFRLTDLSDLLPGIEGLLSTLLSREAIQALRQGIFSFKEDIDWKNVSQRILLTMFRSPELLDYMSEQSWRFNDLLKLDPSLIDSLCYLEGAVPMLREEQISLVDLRAIPSGDFDVIDSAEQLLVVLKGPQLNYLFGP